VRHRSAEGERYPILDPSEVRVEHLDRIEEAPSGRHELRSRHRAALDRALLEPMGLGDHAEELVATAADLARIRGEHDAGLPGEMEPGEGIRFASPSTDG
jgi:hypothetical protein